MSNAGERIGGKCRHNTPPSLTLLFPGSSEVAPDLLHLAFTPVSVQLCSVGVTSKEGNTKRWHMEVNRDALRSSTPERES